MVNHIDMKFKYVPGTQWRRGKAQFTYPMEVPVSYVFLNYTMRDPCFRREDCMSELLWIQKCHTYNAKVGDIRFNFLVGGDGVVYEGRGWTAQPSLPWGQYFAAVKHTSLYIAFMGLFQDEPPDREMLRVQQELLKYGVQQNYITKKFTLYTLRNSNNHLSFSQIKRH